MRQFVSLYVFKILVTLPNRNLECKRNHYILWSRPFQAVNPKVMVSYIKLEFPNVYKGLDWKT